MTDYTKVYNGISKVIWGYFFLYFDINLATVSILPSFVGFIFFSSAIDLLKDEERELSLLKPLIMILGIWEAVKWAVNCVGYNFDDKWAFIILTTGLLNLYFHFQFITNIASIAAKHQKENCSYDKSLLRYRTMQTIMLTVFLIITNLSSLFNEAWVYVSVGLGICYVIICIYIMVTLSRLKKNLKTDDESIIDSSIEISET